MHEPDAMKCLLSALLLNVQYCQRCFFDSSCTSPEARAGHLKTAEKCTYCSSSAWGKLTAGKRPVQRNPDIGRQLCMKEAILDPATLCNGFKTRRYFTFKI